MLLALSAAVLVIAILSAATGWFGGAVGGATASVAQLILVWAAVLSALFFMFVLLAYLDVLPPRSPAVEDVFLLHNSGLLICHYSANRPAGVDPDIASGKLLAAREFAMQAAQLADGAAREFWHGDYHVHMVHGRYTVLVVFARGGRTRRLAEKMETVLRNIEGLYEKVLDSWSGRTEDFRAVDEVLLKLVES